MPSDGSIIIDLQIEKKKSFEELRQEGKKIISEMEEIDKQLDEQEKKMKEVSDAYKVASKNYEKMVSKGKRLLLSGNTEEYEKLLPQMEEAKKLLDDATDKYNEQSSLVNDLNEQYSEKKADMYEILKDMGLIHDYEESETKELEKSNRALKKIKINFKGVEKSASSLLKRIAKFSLMLIGVRSIFALVTRSVNSWLTSNSEKAKQLNADLKFLRYIIAQLLAPAIEYVVGLFYKVLGLVNAILKAFTGVDYFAKMLAKYTKESKKNMQGTLASFDQLEVYSTKEKQPSSLEEETDKFEGFADKIKEFFTNILADFTSDMDFTPLIESVGRLKDALKNLASVGWSYLKDGYELFLKPLATLVINVLLPETINFLADVINWLAETLQEIEPYWQWFLESVLMPLAEWVINEAVPRFFDLLRSALTLLQPVLEIALAIFKDFIEYILKPIAKFTGAVFLKFLELLTGILKKLGNWAKEHKELLTVTFELILSFLAGIWVYNSVKMMIPFLKTLGIVFLALWGSIAKYGLVKGILVFLEALGITLDLVNLKTILLACSFGVLVGALILLVANWDKMSGFQKVIAILGVAIITVVALASAFGALNSAITLGVGAVAIATGIALVAGAISSAQKKAKQEAEQMNAQTQSQVKLAKGGIVNRPTQAIIGEAGCEAVIPLENNTEWIDELANKIGTKQNVTITFSGSLAQLGRVLNPVITQERKRVGTRLITGGV